MYKFFLFAYITVINFTCYLVQAQVVIYSNPLQENELVENNNPAYLVGFLHNNILIGKVNEVNGFYLSVYNNKLGLKNNVIYKELDLEQFDIIDILNFNDLGLLYVHRKAYERRPSIIYAITFSDNGVPIREADILDSLPEEWNFYEKKFSIQISSNKQYALLLTYIQKPNAYLVRGVLLNDEGKILQHYQWDIPFPAGTRSSNNAPQLMVDNNGNCYVLLEALNSQGFVKAIFFHFSGQSSQVTQYPVDLDNLRMQKLKIALDDLHNRLFFYGIYESNNKTDSRGFYGVWWNIEQANCYDGRAWRFNELIPNLKTSQQGNLELGTVIFLKTGGFVGNTIYENSQKLSPFRNINIDVGGRLGSAFYSGFPSDNLVSSAQDQYDKYSENAYIFVINSELKVQATHTIYKHQKQHNDNDLLGISTLNSGNFLYYLYNEFQKTGNITLSSYVLDPKYQFIKKNLGMQANNNFTISLSLGKQIAPFAYLAPCVFKNKWRSFALVVL